MLKSNVLTKLLGDTYLDKRDKYCWAIHVTYVSK